MNWIFITFGKNCDPVKNLVIFWGGQLFQRKFCGLLIGCFVVACFCCLEISRRVVFFQRCVACFFCLVKKLYNPRVKEKEPTNEAIKRLDDNDTVDGSEIRRSPVDME